MILIITLIATDVANILIFLVNHASVWPDQISPRFAYNYKIYGLTHARVETVCLIRVMSTDLDFMRKNGPSLRTGDERNARDEINNSYELPHIKRNVYNSE